jgi:hypothetical protein
VENTVDELKNRIIRVEAKIDFVDGDGDMIVAFADSSELDTAVYSKLYMLTYEKKSGIYRFIPSSSSFTNPDIRPLIYEDFMRRDGQNKTFKGTITRYITFYSPSFDTIKLEFYVIDKANHKSNILEFPDIALIKK